LKNQRDSDLAARNVHIPQGPKARSPEVAGFLFDGTIGPPLSFPYSRAVGRPVYSGRPVTIRVGGGPFRCSGSQTPGSQKHGELSEQSDVGPRRSGKQFRKKENPMGSTSDKVSGLANQAVGKAKEGVGKAVGNDRLRAEGATQEAKGKVQKAVGDAKSAVKDATDKTAAAIKKNL
jgi:uncharacterized protein YjbJ (UPF0337 family)